MIRSMTGGASNMIELGILDSPKVTGFALQNAAPVSVLLLATEAMIAGARTEEEAPAIPDIAGTM